MKKPDFQYQDTLKLILEQGTRVKSQTGTDTITYIAPPPMRFDLENGFPMITERNMAPDFKKVPTVWKQALGEIIGFINGARTQEELQSYGCHWWRTWVTEKKCHKRGLEAGDLGPGSYGAAFYDFPTLEGSNYNQVQNIVEQIIELPHLKTHFISPWIPQYTIRGKGKKQNVVVCPCHGWMHILIQNDKLNLHMFQRSGDVPIGVPSNMVQYAALTMMLAQVTGYKPGTFIHTISDAHIYVDQIPAVKKIVKREPRPFPTMTLKTNNKDIFKFRVDDFQLSDYYPHPGIKNIPVAI
ncbi:MAG: thymidylate synthase [Patescibacteria group bacterium]